MEVSGQGGSHHIAAIAMPRGSALPMIQGTLGPQRLLVLSLSQPITGSFTASHRRPMPNARPACQGGRPAAT